MECPHCNEETFSDLNLIREKEKIYICKKCEKKSFLPNFSKSKSASFLFYIAIIIMLLSWAIPSYEIRIVVLIIAIICLFASVTNRVLYPFNNDKELDKLKLILYNEVDSNIDRQLLVFPNAITWYEESELNSEYTFSIAELYQKKIKDYTEAEKWYLMAIKQGNINAYKELSVIYFFYFHDNIKSSAYVISLIDTKYDKESVLKVLRVNRKIPIETIKQGYELQLNSDEFPIKYKGDLGL